MSWTLHSLYRYSALHAISPINAELMILDWNASNRRQPTSNIFFPLIDGVSYKDRAAATAGEGKMAETELSEQPTGRPPIKIRLDPASE